MPTEVQSSTKLEEKPIIQNDLIEEIEKKKLELEKAQQKYSLNNSSNKNNNNKKKNKKKKKKKRGPVPDLKDLYNLDTNKKEEDTQDVEIEYEVETPNFNKPEYEQFKDVFNHFLNQGGEEDEEGEEGTEGNKVKDENKEKDENNSSSSDSENSDSETDEPKEPVIGKKKLKKLNRLTVAELKQMVNKPEVVEWVDVTASDPKLLITLKAYKNTVPVPQHWSQKRKYLQGKRGIEKLPFELPDFIKQTGIMELRSAVKEKEDQQRLKSKTRERTQPKMGKLDIDYQKLHDAFFRYQTKPKLTIHGELYYEGKEFETKLKEKKPGILSDELKEALNIPPLAAPPWLINMQRYGPPPSYPNLKIPGLNAPIPEGAQWGYQPGGWGEAPVDEYGQPLYGDVFGTEYTAVPEEHIQPIERTLWGELESEEEKEEEEEEEQEEEEEKQEDIDTQGLATPSGLTSVASGLETPDFIELRKDSKKQEEKTLYTIIPQKETTITGFMGSQHIYNMDAVTGGNKRKNANDIEVALNPEELEEGLDEDTVRRKYEQQMEMEKENQVKEDFSDMVAEHAQRQAKKRKKMEDKKYKDFKF